jgi:tripartite-type tricarboxylate transporter receptor subunit TctC
MSPDSLRGENMNRRELIWGAGVVAATGLRPSIVAAQERYPSRPAKLVVPFAAGGATDLFARRYAERLSNLLGQRFVVENKPGAGGIIGADIVAKAKPDGYTLLFGSSSTIVTGPLMLQKPPYDPLKDFVLFVVGEVPLAVAVNPSVPARTLGEFIALLKADPDKYRYSSAGPGSINHLGTELFKLKSGRLGGMHVPYKGNNPALLAVMSGEVEFMLETFGTSINQVQAGKLRYLALCARNRSALMPDLPTLVELGYPDVLVSTINSIGLPAGAPPDVVAVISDAISKISQDQTFLSDLRAMAIEPLSDPDPARAAALFAGEISRWKPIIEASGAKIE